jgi:hypothetical protein
MNFAKDVEKRSVGIDVLVPFSLVSESNQTATELAPKIVDGRSGSGRTGGVPMWHIQEK